MKTQYLDCLLMERYYSCLKSHPGTLLSPIAHPVTPFEKVAIIEGRMVHVMVKHGNRLTVQWVPVTPDIKWLFDAWGQ